MKEICDLFETPKTTDSFFLSFEGIEGAGKTTQLNLFKEMLEEQGMEVTVLREPGGTIFGEKLREAILSSEESLAPIAEAYLFASSRAQLLKERIIPLLAKKKQVVILDRYIDSSISYQGIARGLGVDTVLKIHQQAPLNLLPHMTIYLSISLEESMKRQEKRGQAKDYFESENQEFYQKIIQGYDQAAEIFPQRIKKISANGDVDEVFSKIKICWDNLING